MYFANLIFPLLACGTFVASVPVPFSGLQLSQADHNKQAVTASLTTQQQTMLDHAFETANEIITGLTHVYSIADQQTPEGAIARQMFIDAFGVKTWSNPDRPLEMLQIIEALRTQPLRVFPLNPADAWAKKKTIFPTAPASFYATTPKYQVQGAGGKTTIVHDAILLGDMFWGDFTHRTNAIGTPTPDQALLERLPSRRAQTLIHEAIHSITGKTDTLELTATGCRVLPSFVALAAGSTSRTGYFNSRHQATQIFKDAANIGEVDAEYKDSQLKCDALYYNPDSWSLLASLWWNNGKMGPPPSFLAKIKGWIKALNCAKCLT